MGKTDRRRPPKHPYNTRGRKSRLVADVQQSGQQLDAQLRAMGLRVHPTEGDGNCMFRALSDQSYGSDAQHATLRREVCDWLSTHPERYRAFVDDDRTLEDHVEVMRQLGTYGGHLELSAFAHRFQRDVKVVQPGLVYVISCASPPSPVKTHPVTLPPSAEMDERETRRLRREALRSPSDVQCAPSTGEALSDSAVYVAYHDWEHYSSLRTLTGALPGTSPVVDLQPPHPLSLRTPVVPRPRGRPRKHRLPPHQVPLPPSPPHSTIYRDPSPSRSASTSAPSSAGSDTAASTPPTSNSPKRSASEMSDGEEDLDLNSRARKAPRSSVMTPVEMAEVEAVLNQKLSRRERRAVGRVGSARRVLAHQRTRGVLKGQTQGRADQPGAISFVQLTI